MKRIFIICCMLMCFPAMAHAQAMIALLFGKQLTTDRTELGIYLAAQNSFIIGSDDYSPNLRFAIGAYTDVKLGTKDKFSFINYFIFKSPRGARKMSFDYAFDDDAPPAGIAPEDIDVARNMSYIELLPMISYKLSPSWSVSAGPMIAYCVRAKDEYSYKTDQGEYTYTHNVYSYIQPFDFGYVADVQWRLMHGKGIRLNARLAQSFTEIYKESVAFSGKNIYFQLGCGIQIGSKEKISQSPNVFE